MGAEAYGLVGFFAMIQAWFQLLDMGLTPTMARATAQYRGGTGNALNLRRLLRALEGIFVGVATLAGGAFILFSEKLSVDWLNVQKLSHEEVRNALMLVGIIVSLRWISGLYRGAVNGFEKMVWLSAFNIIVASARFVLVVPVFIFIGTTPTVFFAYQLMIALLELAILVMKVYRLLPKLTESSFMPWDWRPLKDVLQFSLSIAFTSSIWVLVSQTDKLILSKLLPLGDYAYFTLAVLVAGGVTILSGPISTAVLPRLTRVAAEENGENFIRLYRTTTQLIGVVTIPAAVVLALFAEQLLWAWTGDIVVAHKAAPVMALYALGNSVLALAAFPYYLQYAKGNLRLHLLGNLLFVVLLIPSLIAATLKFGAIGAGAAWITSNVVYFIFWVPLVHVRFLPGLHIKWLTEDILKPLVIMVPLAFVMRYCISLPHNRILLFVCLVLIGIVLLAASALGSELLRGRIRARFILKAGSN